MKNSVATRGHKPEVFRLQSTARMCYLPSVLPALEVLFLLLSLQDAYKSLFTPARQAQVFCSASSAVAGQASMVQTQNSAFQMLNGSTEMQL